MNPSSRRQFLKTAGFGLLASSLPAELFNCSQAAKPPNIVLIMADDFGYECVRCNDGLSYQTPNLDQLAESGVRFTQCYAMPLCTPSRVQLMTGQYNFRNYTEFGTLRPGETTFAQLFKQAGYKTCVAGKWQLVGHYAGSNYKGEGTYPKEAGFDEYCLWQVDQLGSRYWNPVINQNGRVLQNTNGQYGPDIVCNYLLDFIERNQSAPFLAYYPMILTHAPFKPTPDSNVEPRNREKGNKKYFADMVRYADKLVGKIIKKLDDLDLRQNTLILFVGDNGTPRGITSKLGSSTIAGGKGFTTTAGTHVPLIVSWGNQTANGSVCDDLIDFTDFLPTLLAAAQIKTTAGLRPDGISFLPQVLGKKGNPREWIFCHYDPRWGKWEKKRYVQNKRWKLYQDGRFFDLQNDPLEKKPLQIEQLPDDVQEIRRKFQAVLEKMR